MLKSKSTKIKDKKKDNNLESFNKEKEYYGEFHIGLQYDMAIWQNNEKCKVF